MAPVRLPAQPAGTPSQEQPEPAAGQEEEPARPAPAKLERFAFGFRVRTLPSTSLGVLRDRSLMSTTFVGRTGYDVNAKTTSRSPSVGGGAAFEFRLAPRVRLTSELLFHRLRYERTFDSMSGTDDPATGHDERSRLSINEKTKGRLWDIPLLLHYRGLRSSGPLAHLWVSGGVAVRSISAIRTRNEIKNPDGSGASDYLAAQPARRNLSGVVVGAGFRFIDDLNIKVTPEIRYTRWSGATFAQETTRSPRGQLEISIGFTR